MTGAPRDSAKLMRQRAEAIQLAQLAQHSDKDPARSTEDIQLALHELQVHQIELEMQNDELIRAQAEANALRALYADLYDLAPVGYCSVNEKGLLLQVNLALAQQVGVVRNKLVGQLFSNFVDPADQDTWYHLRRLLLETGEPQACELRMLSAGGMLVWMELKANVSHQEAMDGLVAVAGSDTADCGTRVVRVTLTDITQRRFTEATLLTNVKLGNAIVDSIPWQLAVLDCTGTIVAVNQAWRSFSLNNGTTPGVPAGKTSVGVNYLDICQAAAGGDALRSAELARDGIVRVISGAAPSFQLEYPCNSPTQSRWFMLTVTPLNIGNGEVVVMHEDITTRRLTELAAKELSENKFRLVADNTSDGIVIFGADRCIQYVSPAYLQQLGYSEAEELNRSPDMNFELFHPQDREAIFARVEHAIESRESDLQYACRVKHRDGHYIWREDNTKFQYDGSGNFAGACVVARDITERRKAEQDLRIAAAAFESQEAMMITDAKSVILKVNRAFTQTTGYTAAEAMGQTPRFLQSGRHDNDFYHRMWEVVRSEGSWQGEVWDRHKDGSMQPKWLTITAVADLGGHVSHYIGSHYDLSERKRAEEAALEMNHSLQQSRQQLRQLVAHNESRLEQERRRIALEVHDELGQILTALRMDMSLAIRAQSSHAPGLRDALVNMKSQVDRAIQGVRNVATSLRPAALDMGLVPAIQWLCNEFSRRDGVTCELNAPEQVVGLDADRAIVVFRIVQESLTNIQKHTDASRVVVSLVPRGRDLSVEVRDNGGGFDVATAGLSGRLGLLGMRERAIALGGRVEVNSTPGRGSVVDLVIPFESDVNGGST